MPTTVTDPYAAARAAWAAEMDRRWASRPDYDVLDIPCVACHLPMNVHKDAALDRCAQALDYAGVAHYRAHIPAPAAETTKRTRRAA